MVLVGLDTTVCRVYFPGSFDCFHNWCGANRLPVLSFSPIVVEYISACGFIMYRAVRIRRTMCVHLGLAGELRIYRKAK
jgi:hypothetical protein